MSYRGNSAVFIDVATPALAAVPLRRLRRGAFRPRQRSALPEAARRRAGLPYRRQSCARHRPDAAHDSAFWILLLHGNAGSAFSSEQLRHCESLRELGFSVLGFDYRGFGMSAGVASEAHMEQDADAAFQALIERDIPPSHIILWGHSLGSGPAVVLASDHAVAALVLFGAFTSIPDAAQDTYPYLPVKWIAGIRFASIGRIARVHVPALITHSAGDTVIPFHHAQRLFAAANEPKRLLVLDGVYSEGFGGHIAALYEHRELLAPALSALIGPQLNLRGATPPSPVQ
jgi:pimeloyl-ACP methyl ester carboxylesterase